MQADYRKRLDDYYEKLQEWKDSLTAEEIQQLEDMRRAKLELKQMRKERKVVQPVCCLSLENFAINVQGQG